MVGGKGRLSLTAFINLHLLKVLFFFFLVFELYYFLYCVFPHYHSTLLPSLLRAITTLLFMPMCPFCSIPAPPPSSPRQSCHPAGHPAPHVPC